jgi:hypothetical protein
MLSIWRAVHVRLRLLFMGVLRHGRPQNGGAKLVDAILWHVLRLRVHVLGLSSTRIHLRASCVHRMIRPHLASVVVQAHGTEVLIALC